MKVKVSIHGAREVEIEATTYEEIITHGLKKFPEKNVTADMLTVKLGNKYFSRMELSREVNVGEAGATFEIVSNKWSPKHLQGQRDVRVQYNIHSISAVDTQDQTFIADVTFKCSFMELRSTFGIEETPQDFQLNLDRSEYRSDKYKPFDPMVKCSNLFEVKGKVETWYNVFPASPFEDDWVKWEGVKECVVVFNQRLTGVFKCHFSLRKFPFDSQDLEIKLVSDRPIDHVNLVPAGEKYQSQIDINEVYLHGVWELPSQQVFVKQLDPTKDIFSTTRRRYPRITCALRIERSPGHYIQNIMIPLSLLTVFAHSSCEIDVTDLGARLSVSLVMVLAAVTFKFVVTQETPQIDYLTIIDVFINFNFFWMMLIVLENVIVSAYEYPRHTERIISGILLLTFLVISLLFGTMFHRGVRKYFPMFHQLDALIETKYRTL